MTKISKREARKLFNEGVDISIGGHDSKGEGATWKASQFQQNTFDNLCDYFEHVYCRGTGRFLKTEFYR